MSLPPPPSSSSASTTTTQNNSNIEYPPSSTSSSSSIVSRQSSICSTNSVQAVPFRSPIRGPLASSGSRVRSPPTSTSTSASVTVGAAVGNGYNGESNRGDNHFLTNLNNSSNTNMNNNTSYFNAAPMMRQISDGTSGVKDLNRSNSSTSRKNMTTNTNTTTGGLLDSFSFGNSFPTLNGSTSTSNPTSIPQYALTGMKDQGPSSSYPHHHHSIESIPIPSTKNYLEVERPLIPRAASSNLSDKPAVQIIRGNRKEEEGSKEDLNSSMLVMRKTPSDFKFGEVLGEGSYSTVTLVTDKLPPYKQYALKVLDKEHIKREKKTKYVLIERDTLKILDGHPGIVRLYWTFQDARSLYYVLELAKNGELLKWIKKFGSFSLSCAQFYSAQILSAVEHIHSKNVIHRDLKPENILLDENMRVKITDFGTAKLLTDEIPLAENAPRARSRSFVGTPEYVSPEILSEKKESSRSSDFWALGCIIFQMIAGRPPFQAKTEYLMFQKIIAIDFKFPDHFDPIAKDLVEKLLVLDPLERLGGTISMEGEGEGEGKRERKGIEEIKSHPFFKDVEFETIWKRTVPDLETGIVGPKEEMKGEFVMPLGFERFVDESDEEEEEEGEEKRGMDEEVLGKGVEKMKVVDTRIAAEPVTKWSGILLPTEIILCASPILDRSSFISKKRTLILTDYSRLICIKESENKVSLKSEIFLGVHLHNGSIGNTNGMVRNGNGYGSGSGGGGNKLIFLKVEMEGEKIFLVKTNNRTFKYEEPSPGGALRWVSELREANLSGRKDESKK